MSPDVIGPIALIVVTVLMAGVVNLIWEIIIGLRAKRTAKVLLSSEQATDPVLHDLAAKSRVMGLTSAEVEAVSLKIEEILKGRLPRRQFRMIEQGLHQPNRWGERRFIASLIG